MTKGGDRRGRAGHFRWRGMETETKQRQDINQGNATAWKTANNTTRKQNKRETEISVRRVSTRRKRGCMRLCIAFCLRREGEYDATCQDKMLCITGPIRKKWEELK